MDASRRELSENLSSRMVVNRFKQSPPKLDSYRLAVSLGPISSRALNNR